VVLLLVWIAVVVLTVVVLGAVAYGVVGAFDRLGREAAALERDTRPVLDELRSVAARAADTSRSS
jgi:hypothetical protein